MEPAAVHRDHHRQLAAGLEHGRLLHLEEQAVLGRAPFAAPGAGSFRCAAFAGNPLRIGGRPRLDGAADIHLSAPTAARRSGCRRDEVWPLAVTPHTGPLLVCTRACRRSTPASWPAPSGRTAAAITAPRRRTTSVRRTESIISPASACGRDFVRNRRQRTSRRGESVKCGGRLLTATGKRREHLVDGREGGLPGRGAHPPAADRVGALRRRSSDL